MRHMISILAVLLATVTANTATAQDVVVNSCADPVTYASAPKRVVVHDKNLTEIIVALGLRDRIVGVTGITGWYEPSKELAEAIQGIPELNPKDPVLENILSVQPDLFIAGWYYGMQPGGPVTPQILHALGINTFVLTESCVHVGQKQRPSLELLFDDIRSLGRIFRVDERSEVLVDQWLGRIKKVEGRVSGLTPVRVFLHYDGDATPFTAGGLGMVQAIVEASGGSNVMSDLDLNWGETSWEVVAFRDPEVIIIFDDQTGEGFHRQIKVLKANPLTRKLNAVINERFIVVQYREIAPGPGNIEAIEKIAKVLHPEAFQ
jgi:iron complex transport system substrate-binding protein